MTPAPVITRFAPSPTGYLHIGGARTALFNWLFAKRHGGQFRVRIEDTDKARSTQAAVDAIFEGLAWLGLGADGDIVSQAAQAERHVALAQQLLQTGHAYRCYLSAEELEALREQAKASGGTVRSPWRDRDDHPADQPFVVRFKTPLAEKVLIDDAVQGPVTFDSQHIEDLVLLRSDGTPTYNLAVVADDHDMGVSHIIRGDDHLNNAAKQALIYQALGWDVPVFAHIPLIHGDDGKKLSKRHGAQAVGDLRQMGYLPEAVRNYLLRLGWSKGDQEIFSDAEAAAAFGLEGINKAPARLDWDKLNHTNAHYIAATDDERLLDLMADHRGQPWSEIERTRILALMPHFKSRAKIIPDLIDQSEFLIASGPFTFTGKVKKQLNPENLERLGRLATVLRALDDWTAESLDQALHSFVEAEGVGFGKVGPVVRAAITGGLPAPDLAPSLAALGQDEVLTRFEMAQNSLQLNSEN